MDRNSNDHTNNNGFLHHILDPHHVGQALTNLVRGMLPQQPQNATIPQSSSQDDSYSDTPPLELPSPVVSHSGTIDNELPQASDPISEVTVTSTSPPSCETTPHANSATAMIMSHPSHSSNSDDSLPDVEMPPAHESASSSLQTGLDISARGSRRARVEDDDEGDDDLRESNRQRMYSPSGNDDIHHFMPIPEDHGVLPQATRDFGASSQHRADPQQEQPPHGAISPSQFSRMMMSIDFVPIPFAHHTNPHIIGNDQPGGHHHHHHDDDVHAHDGQRALNLFINFPITGRPAPPAGEASNNGPNAGPLPGGNAGFMFPPFPFPFGMNMLEERDDPARAKRLVHGLEEVPVGLIKRMERAGGPGTARGEVPTCSICWESLLDPEGGGFEGNAELAEAEAAEAARDDATSQQVSQLSTTFDGPSPSLLRETSPSRPSSTPPTCPETGRKYPKIVVLPCSHTFHATCLQPWFSKPGRTTCPSCRFDIDPDSLTYKPRPLRRRHRPAETADGAAAPPPPQTRFHFVPAPLSTTNTQPAVPPTIAQTEPHIRDHSVAVPDAASQPALAQNEHGQQRQPLPPFVTFDISMIIPIFPGRAAGAPQTSNGARGANPTALDTQSPPLPRTDNNGFRLDDTLLQEAVRTTFERLFGRPGSPSVPQPPTTTNDAAVPVENGPQLDQQWFTLGGPMPAGFPHMPPMDAHGAPPTGTPRRQSGSHGHVEKRPWTLPPAPGPTLRQVVERNEREMGLRCSDVSCGLGPSDDDPMSSVDGSSLKRISIHSLEPNESGTEAVCEHKFDLACLVSAGRIAGWGHEVKTGEPAGSGEVVEVSCPVCRALGVVSRSEWEEGVRALA